RRYLARFIGRHPQIIAYFHGHEHENLFYLWRGPDGDLSLPTVMVDSPMKGKVSAEDETRLSFQSVAVDTVARCLTVREVRWNTTPSAPAITWGDSFTIRY
ncbi:MAG: hypothetical protein LIP77_00255, partial [Planctomycetes bacterium]|nr:hypothetical protein [Planctomycetota bacterium]